MATAVDTEIQDHVDAGPSIYLGLPPEVRNMIYRLLLVTLLIQSLDRLESYEISAAWLFMEYHYCMQNA